MTSIGEQGTMRQEECENCTALRAEVERLQRYRCDEMDTLQKEIIALRAELEACRDKIKADIWCKPKLIEYRKTIDAQQAELASLLARLETIGKRAADQKPTSSKGHLQDILEDIRFEAIAALSSVIAEKDGGNG